MNAPNADEVKRHEAERQHQQKLNMLNLFRLLETAVQNAQFKVGGQIVVRAQDAVGPIKSARTSFEEQNVKAVLELNQAAESFRAKVVRWEVEARAAQAGQRQLAQAQKRQLPAEIATVRSTLRKTIIFFERLAAELAEWARTVQPDQELPEESKGAVEGATKQSLYQRDRHTHVPEPEIRGKSSLSTEGLTMMAMMVRQQFEELGDLFRSTRDRDVGDPIHNAFDAFGLGNYLAARSRLKLAHDAFVKASNTRRIVQAEIAEQRFQTLLQGTDRLAEAANQKGEMSGGERASAGPTPPKASSQPVQDLRKLRHIVQNELDRVFPPGSPKEHKETAKECMDRIASGPLAELPENLRSLWRVTNFSADNNAPAAKQMKALIKRLAACRPEQIRPPRDTGIKSRARQPLAGTEMDEVGITLDFAMAPTTCITVDPTDVREAHLLVLEFRNSSAEPARVQVQLYNGMDKPILSRPEALLLTEARETTSHTVDLAEKIDPRIDDTLAVTVEFVDVPDDVEISSAFCK